MICTYIGERKEMGSNVELLGWVRKNEKKHKRENDRSQWALGK